MSAPNLRRLSSGNRFCLWLCLACLASACELFQPVQSSSTTEQVPSESDLLEPIQGRRMYDPFTGTWVEVNNMPTDEMDTIQWREIPPTVSPPITSAAGSAAAGGGAPTVGPIPGSQPNEYGSQFYSTYNVALLLPFLTDRFNAQTLEIDPNSSWALNFYGGVKMALDELAGEGVSLKMDVIDTKVDATQMPQLLRANQALQQAHLILGPYRRDNIREVASFAKSKGITFVSPYSAADNLSPNNPEYIQVSPTLNSHCEALFEHAYAHFRPDQLVLVSTSDPGEQERLRIFQDAYFQKAGSRSSNKLEELIVSSQTNDFSDLNVQPFIQLRDTTVFLVPSWNESFVYAFLRKLEVSKEDFHEVVVYGMPQWMFFDHVDLQYYEDFNLHVSSNFFLDPLAPNVQFFKRRYFDRFGALAPLEAYLGYDVMLYFGRMLQKHGTKLQYQLEQDPAQTLHTRFEFERVVTPTTTGAEQLPIERFENKYVSILQFVDFQFQLAE